MAPFYDLVHIIYSSKIVDYELYKKKIFVLVVIVKCGKWRVIHFKQKAHSI